MQVVRVDGEQKKRVKNVKKKSALWMKSGYHHILHTVENAERQ